MATTTAVREEAKGKIKVLSAFVGKLEAQELVLIRDFGKYLQTFDSHRKLIGKFLRLSRELRQFPLLEELREFFEGIYNKHFKSFEQKGDWSRFNQFIANLDSYIKEAEKRDAGIARMLKNAKWSAKRYKNQPKNWVALIRRILRTINTRKKKVIIGETRKEIIAIVREFSERIIPKFQSIINKEAEFEKDEIRLQDSEANTEVRIKGLLSSQYSKLKYEIESGNLRETQIEKKLEQVMKQTGEEIEEEETALQLNYRLRELLKKLRDFMKRLNLLIHQEIEIFNWYARFSVRKIMVPSSQTELRRNEAILTETVVNINKLLIQINNEIIRPFNRYFREKKDLNKRVSQQFADKHKPMDILRSILTLGKEHPLATISNTDITRDIQTLLQDKVSVDEIKRNLRKYASTSKEVAAYIRELKKYWDLMDERAKRFVDKALFAANYKMIAEGAMIDTLTRIPARKAFKRALKQEIARSERKGEEKLFFLVFFDIDHFKQFNDTYGHKAGDMVLTAVAQIIKKRLRKYDQIFRYGGEEFCLIIPIGELKGWPNYRNIARAKLNVLERIREGVEQKSKKTMKIINSEFSRINNKPKISNITISMGVSIFPYDAGVSDILIEKADAAMYQAKKAGRNRIAFAKLPTDWAPGGSAKTKIIKPETEKEDVKTFKIKKPSDIKRPFDLIEFLEFRMKRLTETIDSNFWSRDPIDEQIETIKALARQLSPDNQINEINEVFKIIARFGIKSDDLTSILGKEKEYWRQFSQLLPTLIGNKLSIPQKDALYGCLKGLRSIIGAGIGSLLIDPNFRMEVVKSNGRLVRKKRLAKQIAGKETAQLAALKK